MSEEKRVIVDVNTRIPVPWMGLELSIGQATAEIVDFSAHLLSQPLSERRREINELLCLVYLTGYQQGVLDESRRKADPCE